VNAVSPVTRREGLIASALIAGWWIALAMWNGAMLMTRRFWLDELCCTVYALRDSSNPVELVGNALRYDIAPPLLHLITWPLTQLFGSSPIVVRSVALGSVIVATILLYLLMRRRFSVAASAAGVLTLLSNSLVIRHAFEARFYGPWLLLGVALALALGVDAGRPSRRRDVLVALFAVCLCTLHWFGVTSLVLLATGALLTQWPQWRAGLRLIAPAIAGPAVLALLLPAMFRQLSYSGDALLWVPQLNTSQVMQMAQLFWIRAPILIAVVLLIVDRLWPRLMGHDRPVAPVRAALRDPGIAALLAALLMPVVLIVITLVLKPVMVPRYAILAAAAAPVLVAIAFETIGRVGRITIALVLALFAVGFVDRELRQVGFNERMLDEYDAALREGHRLDPNLPLVFQSYFILYPIDGGARRETIGRVMEVPDYALDAMYPDTALAAEKQRAKTDRMMVRLHERTFGFPRVLTVDSLRSTPRFAILARDTELPYGHRNALELGALLFPNHKATRLSHVVTLFERSR
jgi:hypothetical protein